MELDSQAVVAAMGCGVSGHLETSDNISRGTTTGYSRSRVLAEERQLLNVVNSWLMGAVYPLGDVSQGGSNDRDHHECNTCNFGVDTQQWLCLR